MHHVFMCLICNTLWGDCISQAEWRDCLKTWGFPTQFIKSTKVLMATPQERCLGYHTPEQVSNLNIPALISRNSNWGQPSRADCHCIFGWCRITRWQPNAESLRLFLIMGIPEKERKKGILSDNILFMTPKVEKFFKKPVNPVMYWWLNPSHGIMGKTFWSRRLNSGKIHCFRLRQLLDRFTGQPEWQR